MPVVALTLSRGIHVEMVWELGKLLRKYGFHDIEEDYVSCPLGWGGRIGKLGACNAEMFYMAMMPMAAPLLNLTDKEYTTVVKQQLQGFIPKKTWFKAPYAFGRKP